MDKWYVHKHQVRQAYGGPEEGGWWYEQGTVVEDWKSPEFTTQEEAEEACRKLNEEENVRRESEEEYSMTSVLSYNSTFYAYDVSKHYLAFNYPQERPHYE